MKWGGLGEIIGSTLRRRYISTVISLSLQYQMTLEILFHWFRGGTLFLTVFCSFCCHWRICTQFRMIVSVFVTFYQKDRHPWPSVLCRCVCWTPSVCVLIQNMPVFSWVLSAKGLVRELTMHLCHLLGLESLVRHRWRFCVFQQMNGWFFQWKTNFVKGRGGNPCAQLNRDWNGE